MMPLCLAPVALWEHHKCRPKRTYQHYPFGELVRLAMALAECVVA
jgi:hypothetical protein